jgi:hypothetical protein
MLGLIIPAEGQVWFFKGMGPVARVDAKLADFEKLVESIRFEDNRPTWTLPEGWSQQPGNQFRFATLVSDGLEVTVSSLPAPGGAAKPDYILANLNRWRDQLALPPVSLEELEQSANPFELGGRQAYRVDLLGSAPAAGPSRGPFQSAERPSQQPSAVTASSTDPSSNAVPASSAADGSPGPRRVGGMSFTPPKDWQEGRSGGMRLAAFMVQRDDKRAEVTLIPLGAGPSAGSLVDNVNRWRREIDLPPIEQAQVEQETSTIEAGDASGQYIRLVNPNNSDADATLAVIFPLPDRTLFVKMKGARDLVLDEEGNFKRFVESFRFDP